MNSGIKVKYTNYKGSTSLRTIKPVEVYVGCSEWHPERQYILRAWDFDKESSRDFALKDCDFINVGEEDET